MLKLTRFLHSLRYALRGVAMIYREEQNFRVQISAAVMAVLLSVIFGITRLEWLFVILAIALVLIAEAVNSAVERVADLLKPRLDVYVKDIKDIMAGVVFISSGLALVIAFVVFMPHIIKIISI